MSTVDDPRVPHIISGRKAANHCLTEKSILLNWNRLFDTQDLNWWTIVSGIGLNFVLTSFLFLGATPLVSADAPEAVFVTVICLGAFAIPLLTAYICGRLADECVLTYAFYPLIGFLILTVPGEERAYIYFQF